MTRLLFAVGAAAVVVVDVQVSFARVNERKVHKNVTAAPDCCTKRRILPQGLFLFSACATQTTCCADKKASSAHNVLILHSPCFATELL